MGSSSGVPRRCRSAFPSSPSLSWRGGVLPLALRPPGAPRALDETLPASSSSASAAQLGSGIWRHIAIFFSYFLLCLLPQIPSLSRTEAGRCAACGSQHISSGSCAPESRQTAAGCRAVPRLAASIGCLPVLRACDLVILLSSSSLRIPGQNRGRTDRCSGAREVW